MNQAPTGIATQEQAGSAMHVTTFHATSIQAAIEQARRELGSEAMLLNSRRVGSNPAGSNVYAVTFGTSGELPSPVSDSAPRSAAKATTVGKGAAIHSAPSPSKADRPSGRGDETRNTATPTAAEQSTGRSAAHSPSGTKSILTTPGNKPALRKAELDELESISLPDEHAGRTRNHPAAETHSYERLLAQVSSMRVEMMQLAGSVRRASTTAIRPDLTDERLRRIVDLLFAQEFAAPLVEHVIDQMLSAGAVVERSQSAQAKNRGRKSDTRREGSTELDALVRTMQDTVASLIELSPETTIRRSRTRPRVVILVGPPGVGKTTTAVKLAARMAPQGRFPLQLISLDNYRVGASEQLRSYASILGVGFDSLSSPSALLKTIRCYESKELILVDTPGYGWKDFSAAINMAGVLSEVADATIHLVVSASMKATDLTRVADLYEPFGYHSFLFTRIDETSTIGPLISEAWMREKPISYLCAGQRIPEDLEPATRERLVGRILPGACEPTQSAA